MRKKLTLTIDADAYKMIKELPRKISISEAFSFFIKAAYQDLKKGRELTNEELHKWIDSSPELSDFRERLIEQWGPNFKKIDSSIDKVKETVGIKKGKK